MAEENARIADATAPRATGSPRFSIVVPLFDCRDAGTRALESALAQDFRRDGYEVIAVVDARGVAPAALLARCERVVAVDADFAAVEPEIGLFTSGSAVARGEYLYFIEGHTVLAAGALRAIDARLRQGDDCAIVCGRRRNHARTRLGVLIGGNNDAHESRALRQGNFTLGANCVIRRSTFAALGGFEPRFLRFNETVLYHRARAAGATIGAIDATLCTHHNDAGFVWLVRLLLATGRAKARYYQSLADGGRTRLRHPIYRWLGAPPAATLAAWPLCLAGPALIALAMTLARRWPAVAGEVHRIGVGCTDVAGFCFERRLRLGADGERRGEPVPAGTRAASPADRPPNVDFERTA